MGYLFNMEQTLSRDIKEQMALALIYLCSWEETSSGSSVHRAWKGYDFSVLDSLKEQELLHFTPSAKSLYLTDQGLERAKALVAGFSKSMT